ncbi:MAG: hypothetical protein HPY74_16620 [Firmicutes bacterium]|nr:hypothetical protein [Bacillota bacterium]
MYDNNPENGWFVDFKIDDRYKVLNNSADIHLRYTDLTKDASLCICESWIDTTDWSHSKNKQVGNREDWIPTIIVKGEYKSTFAGILEPYEGKSNIFSIKRLELLPYDKKLTAGSCQEADLSSNVAIEVISTTGTCDYIIAVDPCYEKKVICHIGARGQDNRNNSVDSQDELEIETDAWLLIVRKEDGKLCKAVICQGTYVRINDIDIKIENTEDVSDIVEVKFTGKTYSIGY